MKSSPVQAPQVNSDLVLAGVCFFSQELFDDVYKYTEVYIFIYIHSFFLPCFFSSYVLKSVILKFCFFFPLRI